MAECKELLQEQTDEQYISELAEKIVDHINFGNWRKLGRKLGLKDKHLHDIDLKYAVQTPDILEVIYQLLIQWKQKFPNKFGEKILLETVEEMKTGGLNTSQLNEEEKTIISSEIGQDYRNLARELSFKELEINNIQDECASNTQNDSEAYCMEIISRWEKKEGTRASKEKMIKALANISRQDIVDHLCKVNKSSTPIPQDKDDINFEKMLDDIQERLKNSYKKDIQLPNIVVPNENLDIKYYHVSPKLTTANKYGKKIETKRLSQSEIFNSSSPKNQVRRILLEGRIGCGKTTQACKMLQDWVDGEPYMAKFHAVFSFNLIYQDKHSSLEDMVKCSLQRAKIKDLDNGWEAIKKFQDRILLILDSYDSLCENLKGNIKTILNDCDYEGMTIILTTRRGVWKPEKPECGFFMGMTETYIWDKWIIIEGIDEADGIELAKKLLSPENFIKFEVAKKHPDALKNPLLLMLTAFAIEMNSGNDITTTTSIYRDYFYNRYKQISETNVQCEHCKTASRQFDSHDCANEKELEDKLAIYGKIFLEKLITQSNCFEKSQLLEHISYEPDFLVRLGIIEDDTSRKRKQFFTFTHSTFSEYATALYLCQLRNETEFSTKIQELVGKGIGFESYALIFRFIAGFLNKEAKKLFEALAPWGALIPVDSDWMLSILDEIEEPSQLVDCFTPFIPPVFNAEAICNCKNSVVKKLIDQIVKKGFKDNVIKTLEIGSQLDFEFLDVQKIVFVVPPKTEAVPKNPDWTCNDFVCYCNISENVSVDLNAIKILLSRITFENLNLAMKFNIDLQGTDYSKIYSLYLYIVSSLNEIFESIGPIKGVAWHCPFQIIKNSNTNEIVENHVLITTDNEKGMIRKHFNESNIINNTTTKFCLACPVYKKEKPKIDFGTICKEDYPQNLKTLHLEGIEVVGERDLSVTEMTFKDIADENAYRILENCHGLKYLRCSKAFLDFIMKENWHGLQNLSQLYLFSIDHFQRLRELKNLEILSLDVYHLKYKNFKYFEEFMKESSLNTLELFRITNLDMLENLLNILHQLKTFKTPILNILILEFHDLHDTHASETETLKCCFKHIHDLIDQNDVENVILLNMTQNVHLIADFLRNGTFDVNRVFGESNPCYSLRSSNEIEFARFPFDNDSKVSFKELEGILVRKKISS